MYYQEMTIEDAMKICGRNAKVLVAIHDMEKENLDAPFISKGREEYDKIFEDVKTVASYMDDFVRQLRCFTEKQDIRNIKPIGVQKIVLLRE